MDERNTCNKCELPTSAAPIRTQHTTTKTPCSQTQEKTNKRTKYNRQLIFGLMHISFLMPRYELIGQQRKHIHMHAHVRMCERTQLNTPNTRADLSRLLFKQCSRLQYGLNQTNNKHETLRTRAHRCQITIERRNRTHHTLSVQNNGATKHNIYDLDRVRNNTC